MQYSNEFAHHIFTFGITKVITDCNTYSRSDLSDHLCILVCQSFPHFINIGMNTDCTGRTDNTTLSATYAVCFCNLLIKCRYYLCISSTIREVDCIDILYIITHSDTVTTQDTFIRISDNCV